MRQKQLRKAWLLVLLSVSDYKRLRTSLYFITTNFHTELKPQVNVIHDINAPVFTLYTTMDVGSGQKEIWHFPINFLTLLG